MKEKIPYDRICPKCDSCEFEVIDYRKCVERKDYDGIEKEQEIIQLLKEAKTCINHSRQWIRNLKPDFQDDGMYKLIVEKIEKFLKEN